MARTLDEVIKGLPLDRQRKIETETARLIEDDMTLRDLRKAHALTQERIAESCTFHKMASPELKSVAIC
ncbi:MAG: hypothetical protein H7839_10050 [Magnetococcus sp. YQC-5]